MGPDLHRPQPHQARQGCLNRLSFMKTAEPQTYVDRLLVLTSLGPSKEDNEGVDATDGTLILNAVFRPLPILGGGDKWPPSGLGS